MVEEQISLLDEMRFAQTLARNLRARIESHTLNEVEGLWMIERILKNYDHLLRRVEAERRAGWAPSEPLLRPAAASHLVAIDGGLAR